jgi:hypothetical protein
MVGIGLLTVGILVVLVIFAVAVAARNKGGEEGMIRNLYTYLVLFATLMMVIGGGISIFMAAADLISPPAYYQSFSDYKMMVTSEKVNGQKENISEEKIRADYEQLVKDEKNRQQQSAKNQIIKSLGFIVIPLPIFIYFSRMRKRITE